jgi:hypothetical protein
MKKSARKTFVKTLKLLREHLGIRLHHNAKYTQEELFQAAGARCYAKDFPGAENAR